MHVYFACKLALEGGAVTEGGRCDGEEEEGVEDNIVAGQQLIRTQQKNSDVCTWTRGEYMHAHMYTEKYKHIIGTNIHNSYIQTYKNIHSSLIVHTYTNTYIHPHTDKHTISIL
jgi:hypothetical protein